MGKKIEKIKLVGRYEDEYGLENNMMPDMWINATELAVKLNEIIDTLNSLTEGKK